MDYSFNADVARLYGVDEAVFLHNLCWWVQKNAANGKHIYDGRVWTYNSMEAFAKIFPFWTPKQIRRIITKLADAGAIHIGNYNINPIDRTQWYALDDSILRLYGIDLSICPNGQMHLPKRADASDQTGDSICPDGQMQVPKKANVIKKTDSKQTDSKPDDKPDTPTVAEMFDEFWRHYPKKVGKGLARSIFIKLNPSPELFAKILAAVEAQKKLPQWNKDNGEYIPHPSTWLRQGRWEDELPTPPQRPDNGIVGGKPSYDMDKINWMMVHGKIE